jgi:hypothetical protein
MSAQGSSAAQAESAKVLPFSMDASSDARIVKDGDRVAFRVVEKLSADRYRILVGQQQGTVQSGTPLEPGGRYLAEIGVRQGAFHFLTKPIPVNAIENLLARRQVLQTPLASLLRNLGARIPLPKSFVADCQTTEAVRRALLNCGLFYEARVRDALRKGEPLAFVRDLKGFLLAQMSQQPMGSVGEAIATALKQLEVHQLLSLQAGPEGPFSFWLPFGEERIIEGFVKRLRESGPTELLVSLRLSFLPAEELLVTLLWKATRVEVHFAAGPSAYPLLRKAAHRLEDRLGELGLPRTTVRVSRGLPKRLKTEMEGIRFVESYG